MKTNSILTAVGLAAALATAAYAQPAAPEATPVILVNPTPNQVIYLPQLPTATALANAAAAQGISVAQINQANTQITVVYKYSNGQTNTICYQLLSAALTAPTPAGPTTAAPAQTTVIYERSGPGYYYDPYYYPWPWFAPVAVSLGFGFHGGYYHGWGGHGGFHGGGHGWR